MLLHRLHKAEVLNQIVSYLYVPYQFLQLMGYRLVGKQCDYKWRTYRPEPTGPTSRTRHSIALLFPTFVCCVILIFQITLSIYLFRLYFSPQNLWPILVVLVQPIPFCLYAGWMILDFLRLRRLFKNSTGTSEKHNNQG